MSAENVLKEFVGILEEHFPRADTFRPRFVRLDKFLYINDEELDKRDELIEDEAIEFTVNVDEDESVDLEPEPITIPISSVDASSAQIGETNLGVISAVRVAIWKQEPEKRPKLYQYGPYLAHITPENIDFIYNYFRHEIFGMERAKPPRIHKMTDRLRNFFERLAQRRASEIIEDGIVLFDGSLRGATVDTPLDLLRETIDLAHKRSNSVVGISKYSTLRTVNGHKILGMLDHILKPCFRDVHHLISSSLTSQILGRVHIVKFTADGFSFRVDVAPASNKNCDQILRLLKHNCTFHNGYPDPLREVHIHSYFTPDELLSLQNMAIEKYNMQVLRSFDVRRCILPPFGG